MAQSREVLMMRVDVGVLLFVVIVFLLLMMRQKRRVWRAIRGIGPSLDAVYQRWHQYVEVDPTDFSFLDLRYYDDTAASLEAEGFKRLGDFEDLTLTMAFPTTRTFVRSLVSSDGSIRVGIYHSKHRGLGSVFLGLVGVGSAKIIDFESEFSDGHFLLTSNATLASSITQPPEILCEYLPSSTPITEMLNVHRQRVAEYQRAHPQVLPERVFTLRELFASQNRMMAIKSRFRRSLGGGITEEEMRRIAGDEYQKEAELLLDEIRKSK
jgi:hypothetical protein